MQPIQPTTRLIRDKRIIEQEAAGTVVLVHMDNGKYYSLEGIGGRAWELCDGQRTVAEMARALETEFDAPLETIERDLIELFTDLANENLVVECAPQAGGA